MTNNIPIPLILYIDKYKGIYLFYKNPHKMYYNITKISLQITIINAILTFSNIYFKNLLKLLYTS